MTGGVCPNTPLRCWGRLLAAIAGHLMVLLLFSTTVSAQIISANRTTSWHPGVTYNGGIANRTTIYQTLSPSGGDDTVQIQNALNSCPANQVVQLTAGTFKINSGPVNFTTSNCTLRGAGPGTPGAVPAEGANVLGTGGVGGTRLVRPLSANDAVLNMGWDGTSAFFGTTVKLAANAVKGTNSLTLASNPGVTVGDVVLVDMIAKTDPDFWWGNQIPVNSGSEWWFGRVPYSVGQLMMVTAVNGNTITFETPFHISFTVANTASLTIYPANGDGTQGPQKWSGVEGIYFTGGRNGGVSINRCAYCWFKNIEVDWSSGSGVAVTGAYRSEVRDSYIHGTPNPDPGGSGYLLSLTEYTSDSLIENNILWYGNKVITMQRVGGGNVVGYNYMDDAFGSGYPQSPEAGLNAGHYAGSHMALLEGNYSHNYKGDDYWGASPWITVFRNHLSALRAAHPPLNTYKDGSGQPYMDLEGRAAVDVQKGSYYTNFVGNVLGLNGQTVLSYNGSGYSFAQTGFAYEAITSALSNATVVMWNFGAYQDANQNWLWDATTINTQQRDGNWDWFTKSQRWHGIGGSGASTGTPQTIPNSLYLTSTPAFFGSNTWPWVDPTTGTTYTLPAKARFDAGTPNQIGNQSGLTIAVSASPTAGGTVSGGGTFTSGSSDTVTATANSGYVFSNWTESGTVVSTAASYTFTLTANRNLVANFTVNPVNYTIALSASPSAGGTVSGSGTFTAGTPRTVTATANSGYTFANWTENGTVVSSGASYTFTLAANRNLVANFTANQVSYTIALSASPSAGGTVSGGGTFAGGSARTVTATANSGYVFTNWTENGTVVSSGASYTFTLSANRTLVANFQTAQPPAMSTPTPSSALAGTSVTFTWTAGSGYSQYWLSVGTTAGGTNLYNSSTGTNLSATVNGLPASGQTLYVRLWWQSSGVWSSTDYTYQAANPQKAVLITPTPGSVLPATSSSVTFSWTSGLAVTQYWLLVGATPGGSEYYNASTGTALSATSSVPLNGQTIYVRLFSMLAGSWQFNDYTYTAGTGQIAVLSTPAPQSLLPGSSVTFSWTAGTGASQYWLAVGSKIGGTDYYNASTGTTRSVAVNGLPTDGRMLYVRLFSMVSGAWQFNDYRYTAGPGFTAPLPQSTLSGATVSFNWSAATGATQYWLMVSGTALGGSELSNQSTGTAQSASVSGLPTDGRTIYVRLWYQVAGTWLSSDYLYTASGASQRAQMSSPTPGLTLASTAQTFAWTAGTGYSQYWLSVGTTQGGTDLYNSSTGTNLSVSVSNLPTNGSIVYVRLWFLSGTTWLYNDLMYYATKGS